MHQESFQAVRRCWRLSQNDREKLRRYHSTREHQAPEAFLSNHPSSEHFLHRSHLERLGENLLQDEKRRWIYLRRWVPIRTGLHAENPWAEREVCFLELVRFNAAEA